MNSGWDYTGALSTIDVRRHYSHNGDAYGIDFMDPTGIPAGTSYFYWGVNTSTDKYIHVDPVDFNSGTLEIAYVLNGTFTKNSAPYTPVETPDIILPSHNMNLGSTKTSSFVMYFQGVGGTANPSSIQYTANTGIAILEGVEPSIHDTVYLLPPGGKVMGILTNYGATKIPYRMKMFWYDVSNSQ